MADEERAVVDRIVDGTHAVLLVGDEETEQVVPAERLPATAREGTWLHVTRDDTGRIVEMEVDEAATEEAQERIASKIEQLRRRRSRIHPDP